MGLQIKASTQWMKGIYSQGWRVRYLLEAKPGINIPLFPLLKGYSRIINYNIVMHPAIFLDRDGVIIENRPNYVRSWEDVAIYPQAVLALLRIRSSPYKVIIVTNQSAVGRGFLSYQDAEAINRRLIVKLERAGCRIDGLFMCPHAPEDRCACRKPQPGLILQAVQVLSLDVSRSWMIGDAWSDLLAGHTAGIRQNVLVRTGRGQEQSLLPKPPGLESALIYDTLAQALDALIIPATSLSDQFFLTTD
jgi:D-glycero-D-manno-heptose 1,7-bisphosphate phosphatase